MGWHHVPSSTSPSYSEAAKTLRRAPPCVPHIPPCPLRPTYPPPCPCPCPLPALSCSPIALCPPGPPWHTNTPSPQSPPPSQHPQTPHGPHISHYPLRHPQAAHHPFPCPPTPSTNYRSKPPSPTTPTCCPLPKKTHPRPPPAFLAPGGPTPAAHLQMLVVPAGEPSASPSRCSAGGTGDSDPGAGGLVPEGSLGWEDEGEAGRYPALVAHSMSPVPAGHRAAAPPPVPECPGPAHPAA